MFGCGSVQHHQLLSEVSLMIAYDGYYGPGTGTFLMIIFIRAAKMDTRHAAGGVKVINLSSNIGSLVTQMVSGYVFWGVGLIAAAASIAGHYIGSGLAIKNGSKIVRPAVIVVLVLLTLKVGSELLLKICSSMVSGKSV